MFFTGGVVSCADVKGTEVNISLWWWICTDGSYPPSGPWPDVWYCSPADTEQNKQNRENRRAVQHLIWITHSHIRSGSASIISSFVHSSKSSYDKLSWGLPAVCVCSVAPGWPVKKKTHQVYMKKWSWSFQSLKQSGILDQTTWRWQIQTLCSFYIKASPLNRFQNTSRM